MWTGEHKYALVPSGTLMRWMIGEELARMESMGSIGSLADELCRKSVPVLFFLEFRILCFALGLHVGLWPLALVKQTCASNLARSCCYMANVQASLSPFNFKHHIFVFAWRCQTNSLHIMSCRSCSSALGRTGCLPVECVDDLSEGQ